MASLLFKDKKGGGGSVGGGVNFSCVSPASAAICTSIDLRSTVQPAGGGSRALDRHTLHLRDPRRRPKSTTVASMSQMPTRPKTVRLKSSERPRGGMVSVPGSARYLLGGDEEEDDGVTIDGDSYLEETEKDLAPLVSLDPPTLRALMSEPVGFKACSVSAAAAASVTKRQNQVVALRVSLHCKGCEGKVRKHISKMEGVTSFEIDFASKKVTVVGDVTPLGVLSSISKVKHAQFWPSPAPPSDSLLPQAGAGRRKLDVGL